MNLPGPTLKVSQIMSLCGTSANIKLRVGMCAHTKKCTKILTGWQSFSKQSRLVYVVIGITKPGCKLRSM